MVNSGILVSDKAKETFGEMSKNEAKKKYDFITFGLDDAFKEIIVKETMPHEGSKDDKDHGSHECREYLSLRKALKGSSSPLWGVCYVRWSGKFKLTMVKWSPEDAKLKEKMTATATHDTIKRGLQCSVVLQCNDEGDLELASVLENVQKFTH